jgi:uncharacterized membrane protein YoaK (UPF0700 family)
MHLMDAILWIPMLPIMLGWALARLLVRLFGPLRWSRLVNLLMVVPILNLFVFAIVAFGQQPKEHNIPPAP